MMSLSPAIQRVMPTPFLRRAEDGLRQVAHVTVTHAGATQSGAIHVTAQGVELVTPVTLVAGESTIEVEVAEVTAPCAIDVALVLHGHPAVRISIAWIPPKHWVVHVVQLSHHDAGYTDLASHVIPEHDQWLDDVIDIAEATRDFPHDARFRAVIEQTWSIDHFLRTARSARVAAMLDLLRRGDMELTALFGNMVTELCGHETLARCVYHAFRLKRAYGIPILSAEHNDVPGFSWGVSQVLAGAGIKVFCPGFPQYYSWANPRAASFWNETAIFGAQGMPGAFWWEAPAGTRVLFWSNNQGCGGDCHAELPGLSARLQELTEAEYPYTTLRWPVGGGARDNSPYIEGYVHTIRAWNACWAYPRLISSTNTRFYHDLLPQLPATLPVWRGEVPGQDYPVGATSTAAATGINRRNHTDLPAAEALATLAGAIADYQYQDARIFQAYEETLWHDEHTWGHHFPCGPTADAAELEKALHAYRAAALAHDIASKAMARVADAVRLDTPGLHLVVFNPLPRERSGTVTTPLREFDNCGSAMTAMPDGSLRGVLLQDRWHVNPPIEIVEGKFDLIDVATGAVVPYQISEISSPLAATPHAGQRQGLGAGGKRYGFFELPSGIARELSFIADAVPPVGYRTFRLQPREDQPVFAVAITASPTTLENAYYRMEIDAHTGHVRSLLDKETGRELVDPTAPHPFGTVVVRDPFGGETCSRCTELLPSDCGPLSASLCVRLSAPGHPCIEQTYRLPSGEKRLDIAIHLLKDPTPLLETFLAFPFLLPEGRFRYEGPLCVLDPAVDLLPGAYADRLTVQNWITVTDGELSVLWSSREAPVVSLARLWPGRLSPAHSAVVRADVEHPCPDAADLRGGTIYSLLTANNVGTNFAVAQQGSLLFRYSMTTMAGQMTDSRAVMLGQQCLTPLPTLFTKHPGPRPLSPTGSFLAIDHPSVALVALKRAEDGEGLIIRLWNASAETVVTRVVLPNIVVNAATLTTLAEEETGKALAYDAHGIEVPLPPRGVVTVRLHGAPTRY